MNIEFGEIVPSDMSDEDVFKMELIVAVNSEATWKLAKRSVLGGEDPQTKAEWEALVTVIAQNVDVSVAPEVAIFVLRNKGCPLSDAEIQQIAIDTTFPRNDRQN